MTIPIQEHRLSTTPLNRQSCEVCERACDVQLIELRWKSEASEIRAVCGTCWRSMRRGTVFSFLIQVVGPIIVSFAGLTLIVFLALLLTARASQVEHRQFELLGGAAAVVTIVAVAITRAAPRLRVPPALRADRKPRQFLGGKWLGDTPDQAAQALVQKEGQAGRREDAIISAIEGGATLYTIARFFRSLPAALEMYGAYQSNKHGAQDRAEECCECGVTDELRLVAWTWVAPPRGDRTNTAWVTIPLLFAGHIHGSFAPKIKFVTHHVLCRRCLRAAVNRKATHSGIYKPATFIGLFAGGVLALAGLVCGVAQRNRELSRDGYIILIVGVAVTVISLALMRVERNTRVPKSLRAIGRVPFNTGSLRVVNDLPNAG